MKFAHCGSSDESGPHIDGAGRFVRMERWPGCIIAGVMHRRNGSMGVGPPLGQGDGPKLASGPSRALSTALPGPDFRKLVDIRCQLA